jgi:dGTPase
LDDAAYSIVDLEDGVKKEVISWPDLQAELQKGIGQDLFAPLLASMKKQLDGKTEPDNWVDGNAFAQAFRVAALGKITASIRDMFKDAYPEIMEGAYDKELIYDDRCKGKVLVEVCKNIGIKEVYPTSDILRLELRGRRVVHDLMDVFWEGAKVGGSEIKAKDYPGKIYKLISKNYQWIFDREMAKHPDESWERYFRLQLVTDYITGMTDGFACALHANIFNG